MLLSMKRLFENFIEYLFVRYLFIVGKISTSDKIGRDDAEPKRLLQNCIRVCAENKYF